MFFEIQIRFSIDLKSSLEFKSFRVIILPKYPTSSFPENYTTKQTALMIFYDEKTHFFQE